MPSSVVRWNGSPRPTTFSSSTQLLVQIPASDAAAAATVQITVTQFNDPPVPQDQNLVTSEEAAVDITLIATDPDTVTEALVFTLVTQPASGVLSGAAPNLSYTPNANFHGADQFTFTVTDGAATSTEAVVSLMVTPVNDPPLAQDQILQTQEDTDLPIILTGADVDGDTLMFVILTEPGHGTLSGTAPTLVYEPAPGYFGSDSFTFTV